MLNNEAYSVKYRALLTDTLPYEVPVIFSNDRFHLGLCAPLADDARKAYEKIARLSTSFTVPYNYSISKDKSRRTTLSIVHPLAQKAVAEFYLVHSGSMLNYCSGSRFSLRKPTSIASPFGQQMKDESADGLKVGLVEAVKEDGQPDVSHLSSYFVYGKYNLFGKFMDSREFIRLESKFEYYRSADVSKCFYNIYTHSLSWAVKNKEFAKENRLLYSFESEFDKLMQICNYSETNGIVVGPEFSRIFAEIILQDVDNRLERELRDDKLFAGSDYDIRRYVDDYAIFANDKVVLGKIESALKAHLEFYKLFINDKKVIDVSRPFVSTITLARDELGPLLRSLQSKIAEIKDQPLKAFAASKFIRSQAKSIRIIVAKHQISFSNISGWIMSILRRALLQTVALIKDSDLKEIRETLCDIVTLILEVAFYICSMDTRVRTTYSICQLILVVHETFVDMPDEQVDTIRHVMMEEISNIVRTLRQKSARDFGSVDNIELFNLLICGAHFIGEEFLQARLIQEVLENFVRGKKVSYFAYITAKFCYLRDEAAFADQLGLLDRKVCEYLEINSSNIGRDSEVFLFFSEYISDTSIDIRSRMTLFQQCVPGPISRATFEDVAARNGFADWTGISVKHLLRRKELRPVYAWR